MTIGQSIRKARKARGFTLRSLAAASGYSVTFLCDVERGRSNPSLKMLFRAAVAIGVKPGELLEGVELSQSAPCAGAEES